MTYYLTEEGIDRTLEVVRRLPSGSEIVFEYAIALELLPPEEKEQIAAGEAQRGRWGEPTVTRFVPTELQARLHRIGFSQVQDFTHEDGQERYFKDRRDGLAADPATHLMRAIV